MIPDGYVLTAETPSDADYLRLRVAAGLSRKSPEGAAIGLANSWHAVVERLRAAAPSRAHVALIADGEAHRLYAQYGFTLTAPGGVGMQMVIP